MRQKTVLVFLLAAGLLAIVPARAQAQNKRVHLNLGGGLTVPNSEVKDHFGNGYNFNFGVDVAVNPIISIEGLYSFNGLGEKNIKLPVSVNPLIEGGVPTDFFANMNMQFGTGSVIVQMPEGTVRPYGLVGMGVYYRPVEVTSPAVGFVPGYCDPWWYVCYPGGFVAVDKIVGSRSSTDFGMSFGGGLHFGPAYAELRYHYIWGPEVEQQTSVNPLANVATADLAGHKANGQFLQTTFGVRF
jgi:opacity protein-like surface antigen